MKLLKLSVIVSILVMAISLDINATKSQEREGFSFAVSPEFFHYKYEETVGGLYFMDAKGFMGGVNVGANYKCGQNYFGLTTRFAHGNLEYNSRGTGRINDDPNHYFDTRLTHGYRFTLTSELSLMPFWGLGYRYLVNDGKGQVTTTGAIGYYRNSKYFYMPLGTKANYKIDQCSRVNFSAEYDLFLQGKQRSDIRGFSYINDQNSGYGYRASVGYERDLQAYSFEIKPYFRYWNIDDSNVVFNPFRGVFVMEPHNTTKEAGLAISVKM